MAVARNLLINQLRQRGNIPLDTVSPREILDAVDNDRVADSEDIALAVRDALERLPTGQAQLLEAFHYKRTRVAQIAIDLGLSERAIEGRLRRARESLRRELELTLRTEGD
jgi:RNA polymerase sigma-70 factor (ECF subfamily)